MAGFHPSRRRRRVGERDADAARSGRRTFDGSTIVAALPLLPHPTDPSRRPVIPAGASPRQVPADAPAPRPAHPHLTADLAASRVRGEVADVLIAAEWPIYGRFGYGPATMSTSFGSMRLPVRRNQASGPSSSSNADIPRAARRSTNARLDRAGMIGATTFAGTPWPTYGGGRRTSRGRLPGALSRRRRRRPGVGQLQGREQVDGRTTPRHRRGRRPVRRQPGR